MSTHFSNGTNSVTSNPNGIRAGEIQCEGSNGHSSSDSNVRPYPVAEATYEEVVQRAELFWEKLEAFHRSLGTKFSAPTVGGKALDLHRLFLEITSRGGIDQVIRDRRWKEVTALFTFTTPMVSVSFVLRKHYLSLVYHFEQVYYFNKKVLLFLDSVNPDPHMEAAVKEQFSEAPKLQLSCSMTGNIDAKIDNGYLVSVKLGSEELKGVLYHCPHEFHSSGNFTASEILSHNNKGFLPNFQTDCPAVHYLPFTAARRCMKEMFGFSNNDDEILKLLNSLPIH